LVIVSDGILEASGRDGDEFGESRLLQCLKSSRERSASDICSEVLDQVKRFSQGQAQADDLTVVAAKVLTKF
jgi:phosphoserine phosphatase RsbU/P